ncbi:hypothetical protein [Enterobacter roggenkampii]|uniref:hypothetical protein n=1 Tax=Enterobacter roggenkampii TaxID=1812935 RepID=UPI0020757B74|nr:hypothetical protein [Enterobacter roggenkampii]MCM7333021.1 hypothetical protein [Enterobacter roggenkampii]
MVVDIFSLNFIGLYSNLSPAFAPKDANQSRLRAAFFVSEIQYLPIIPALLTLSRSTGFNVHLPTDVGTDDGFSGSIMLVPTGRG